MATQNSMKPVLIPYSALVQIPGRDKDVSQLRASPHPQTLFKSLCLENRGKRRSRRLAAGAEHPAATRNQRCRETVECRVKEVRSEPHRPRWSLASPRATRVVSFHCSKPQSPHL